MHCFVGLFMITAIVKNIEKVVWEKIDSQLLFLLKTITHQSDFNSNFTIDNVFSEYPCCRDLWLSFMWFEIVNMAIISALQFKFFYIFT